MAAAIKKLSSDSGKVRAINLAIINSSLADAKCLRYNPDMTQVLLFLLIGVVSGGLFSLIGTGSGLLIIPALVFLAHFSQKMAVGTSITLLLPPIGFFAALEYWRHGNVNWRAAGLIFVGFVVSSFFVARYANDFSTATLERLFGLAAILIGLKMLISA